MPQFILVAFSLSGFKQYFWGISCLVVRSVRVQIFADMKDYCRRVQLILRSELSWKKIEVINSLAIPTVQHSFGIIDLKYLS